VSLGSGTSLNGKPREDCGQSAKALTFTKIGMIAHIRVTLGQAANDLGAAREMFSTH
jgi:hypothetical protein